MHDAYSNTAVLNLDFKDAVSLLGENCAQNIHQSVKDGESSSWSQIIPIDNAPKFVVFYKEDCPFCAKMHKDFIKMAEDVSAKHQ